MCDSRGIVLYLQSALYFFSYIQTWIEHDEFKCLHFSKKENTLQRLIPYTKKVLYKKHHETAMVISFKILTSKRPRPHCGKCPKPSSSCSWWIRLPPILGIEKPESITIFQFWRPAGRSRRGVKHQPIFYTSPSLSALQTRLLDGAIAHWSKFKVADFIKVLTPCPSALDFWNL